MWKKLTKKKLNVAGSQKENETGGLRFKNYGFWTTKTKHFLATLFQINWGMSVKKG